MSRKQENCSKISVLVCSTCQHYFPIPRPPHQKRERNHIKTMYCPYCKDTREFIENINVDHLKDNEFDIDNDTLEDLRLKTY